MRQTCPGRRYGTQSHRIGCCAAVLALTIGLMGCTMTPTRSPISDKRPPISGLVVHNDWPYPIHDVKVTVVETGAQVGCDLILAGTFCARDFPEQRYEAKAVQVAWRHRGQKLVAPPYVMPLPGLLSDGQAVQVLVIIGGTTGFDVETKARDL